MRLVILNITAQGFLDNIDFYFAIILKIIFHFSQMSNISLSSPKAFTKSQNSHQPPPSSNQSQYRLGGTQKKGSRDSKEQRSNGPLLHYSEKNMHAPNWDIPAAPPVPSPKKKNFRYMSNKVSHSKGGMKKLLDPNGLRIRQGDGISKMTPDMIIDQAKGLTKESIQYYIENIMQIESKYSIQESEHRGREELDSRTSPKLTLEPTPLDSSSFVEGIHKVALQKVKDSLLQKQSTQEFNRDSSLEARSSVKKYLRGSNQKSTKALQLDQSQAVLIQNQKSVYQKLLNKSASLNQLIENSTSGLESRSLSLDKYEQSQLDSIVNQQEEALTPDRHNNKLELPRLQNIKLAQLNQPPTGPDHWKLVRPQNLIFNGSTNFKISISPPPQQNYQPLSIGMAPIKIITDTAPAFKAKKRHYKTGGILNSLLDDKNAYAISIPPQSPSVTLFSGKQVTIPYDAIPPIKQTLFSTTSQPSLVINPKAISHTLTLNKSRHKKPPMSTMVSTLKPQLKSLIDPQTDANGYPIHSSPTNATTAFSTIPRMAQPVFSDVQKKAFRIKKPAEASKSPEIKLNPFNANLHIREQPEEDGVPEMGNGSNGSLAAAAILHQSFDQEYQANIKGLAGLPAPKLRIEQEIDRDLIKIQSFKKTSQSLEDSPEQLSPKIRTLALVPVKKSGMFQTIDFSNQKMGMRGTPLGLEIGQGAQMKMVTKKYRPGQHLPLGSPSIQNLPLKDQQQIKTHLTVSMILPLIGKSLSRLNKSPDENSGNQRYYANHQEIEEAIKNSLIPQDSLQSNDRPKLAFKQPTSSLTLMSPAYDKVTKVHFSDSVEVYTNKQFAPGPTPPTVNQQKKKLKDRYSFSHIKKILFQGDQQPSSSTDNLQEVTEAGEYALDIRMFKEDKILERFNNDVRRVQLAETIRMEQFQKKNQEIQENLARQAVRNMNLERIKLVVGFVNHKKEEEEQQKVPRQNLLKFSRELETKQHQGSNYLAVASRNLPFMHEGSRLEGFNGMLYDGKKSTYDSFNKQKQQRSTSSNEFNECKASVKNVKYKLNIHLV